MKKRIVKLNESDLERLVQKIIKEDQMTSSDLKKSTKNVAKTMSGLSGDDKIAYEGLLQLAEKLKEPGNQITGNFKTKLFQLFKEAGVNI
jgi:hypothetical protein